MVSALKMRKACPVPRAKSGSLDAPKSSTITANTISSSGAPMSALGRDYAADGTGTRRVRPPRYAVTGRQPRNNGCADGVGQAESRPGNTAGHAQGLQRAVWL